MVTTPHNIHNTNEYDCFDDPGVWWATSRNPHTVGAPQRHLPHNPQKKGKSNEMQFKHWYEAFSMSYMFGPLYIEQPTLYNESMLIYSVIVVHASLSKTLRPTIIVMYTADLHRNDDANISKTSHKHSIERQSITRRRIRHLSLCNLYNKMTGEPGSPYTRNDIVASANLVRLTHGKG